MNYTLQYIDEVSRDGGQLVITASSDDEARRIARKWATEWVSIDDRIEAARIGAPIRCEVVIYDEDGEEVDTVIEKVEPLYPTCVDGTDNHDWRQISGILHGGGIRMEDYCARCKARRIIDTWAEDGRGGYERRESITPFEELEDPDVVAEWLRGQA